MFPIDMHSLLVYICHLSRFDESSGSFHGLSFEKFVLGVGVCEYDLLLYQYICDSHCSTSGCGSTILLCVEQRIKLKVFENTDKSWSICERLNDFL